MKIHRCGTDTHVELSEDNVAEFATRWPCFGQARPLSFTFDARGDLVDMAGDSDGMDQGGVLALSAAALQFAQERFPG